MKKVSPSFTATHILAVALWAVAMPLFAAAGASSSGASACTVTVYTTNEDGSTDNSVRPFQALCRLGQSNGDVEYYNPYTDSYESKTYPRIEPLVDKGKSSGSSRSATGSSQAGGRSTTGSSSSQAHSTSSGAPCTTSGKSSKAVKNTRSTTSGRSCTSAPR